MTEEIKNPANLSGCCGSVRIRDAIRVQESGGVVDYGTVNRCGKCFGFSGACKFERTKGEFKTEAVARIISKRRTSYVAACDFKPEDRNQDRQGADAEDFVEDL